MEFDWGAFILGVIVCGVWSSIRLRRATKLADRRFFGACAATAWERLGAYTQYKTHQAFKAGELEDDGWTGIPLEELLPWEDEKYAFVSLGKVDQNDFYITTHYGVILKEFGVHILIEESYDCVNSQRRYIYIIADESFQKVAFAYSTG